MKSSSSWFSGSLKSKSPSSAATTSGSRDRSRPRGAARFNMPMGSSLADGRTQGGNTTLPEIISSYQDRVPQLPSYQDRVPQLPNYQDRVPQLHSYQDRVPQLPSYQESG